MKGFNNKVSDEDMSFVKQFNKTGMNMIIHRNMLEYHQNVCTKRAQKRLNEVKALEASKEGKTADEVAEIDRRIADLRNKIKNIDKMVSEYDLMINGIKHRMNSMKNERVQMQRSVDTEEVDGSKWKVIIKGSV